MTVSTLQAKLSANMRLLKASHLKIRKEYRTRWYGVGATADGGG